jgi:carboxyl-terminal processing protease
VAQMLEPLDSETMYITPEMTRGFQAGSGAATAGIGVNLRKEVRTDLVQVVTPLKNGAAYRAGIRAGDVITQLIREVDSDGRPLRPAEVVRMQGLALKDVVKKLQGRAGTKIKVVVRREGIDQPLTFEMVRGQVRTESVLGFRRRADDNWEFLIDPVRQIGYVRLSQFDVNSAKDLGAVLEELRRRGMKGLVLDLRFNKGGLLTTSIDVADLFITDSVIVSVRPFKDPPISYVSQKKGSYCDFPLVCLINNWTAAGSEIVAACLQDHHRAVLVGERSYGLGIIKSIMPFDEGYLQLTTAVFERASGRNFDKATTSGSSEDAWGVRPDWGLALELSAKERADLEDNLRETEIIRRHDRPYEAAKFRDRQLEMALEHLRKTLQRP